MNRENTVTTTDVRYRLILPVGTTPLLTDNQRLHWTEKARLTRYWRRAAGWAARAQHLPRLDTARIVITLHVTDRRRRDPSNWTPTGKALVDGLVDAGVFDDDNHLHVVGPDLRLHINPHGTKHLTVDIQPTEKDAP